MWEISFISFGLIEDKNTNSLFSPFFTVCVNACVCEFRGLCWFYCLSLMCLDEHEMSWKYGLPCDSHQCSFSRFFVYSKITINNNLQHPCKEKEMEIVVAAAAALTTGDGKQTKKIKSTSTLQRWHLKPVSYPTNQPRNARGFVTVDFATPPAHIKYLLVQSHAE